MGQRPKGLLVCEVDGRRFGLDAGSVQEVVRAVATTPLPMATPLVEGVMGLRGQVVPVLDLRAKLRLPAKGPEPSDDLVVARAGGHLVALRVDRALDLVDLSEGAGAGLEGHPALTGEVALLPEGPTPILDLDTFLSADESATLRGALPGVSPSARGEEGRA